MIVLCAGLGQSLTDLAAKGQLARFVRYDLRAYVEAFAFARDDGVPPVGAAYLSYDPRDDSRDPATKRRLGLEPFGNACWVRTPPRPVHRWLWAAVGPLWWRSVFRQDDLLGCRVLNASGALPALVARVLYGLPYVLQLGYDAPAIARAHGHPGRALGLAALTRLAVDRAAGAVAAREDLPGVARARRAGIPVLVQGNGVDLTVFFPRLTPRPARWTPRVGYLGRLEPEKRLESLVEAMRGQRAVLILVGDGSEAWSLQEIARVLGVRLAIHPTLAWAGVPELLRGLDCFVLPSSTEGSSKILLEAMATGLPCIVSPGAAGPIIAGKTGLIAEGDVAIRDALAAVLGSPLLAARLGEEARAWVIEHADIHRLLARETAFVRVCLEPDR